MPEQDMCIKRNVLKKSLGALILAVTLILSGCSDVVRSNPIVKNIQNGQERVDISAEELTTLFDGYQSDEIELAEVDTGEIDSKRPLFDDFIARVNNADTIEYRREFSYSGEQPVRSTEGGIFLGGLDLHTIEKKDRFVLTNVDATQRLLFDGSTNQLINLVDKTAAEVTLTIEEQRHFLAVLSDSDRTQLTITEVGTDTIGSDLYTVFTVEENGSLAKWYFSTSGDLFLRVFLEQEVPCAIRYQMLNLDPTVDEQIFTLEYSLNDPEESVPEESEESKVEESSKVEISKKSEEPSKVDVSPKPEASKKPDVPVSVVNPPKAEPSKPAAPYPIPGVPTDGINPSTVSPPPRSETSQVAGTSETSKEPSKKPLETPKSPVLENYPSDILPLVPGITVISSSDETTARSRIIRINGTMTTSMIGAVDYYNSRLKGSLNYREKEYYDESGQQTYYTIDSAVNGWQININIAESHITKERTITIRLEK